MNEDTHTLDAADDVEERLRRTLHAVAATTPVEDRRASLLAALDAAETTEPTTEDDAMHLDARTDPARPIWRRPMFLAAAAALVVVAVVGAVLAGDDDGAVEVDPADPVEVQDTGWFVPNDGWEITAVRSDFVDVGEAGGCPCRVLIASGEGQQPPAIVVQESSRPPELDPGTPIDVGGRPGELVDLGPPALRVGSGDHHLLVVSSSVVQVDQGAVVALADAWLDRVEAGEEVDPAELPLPDGMAAGDVVPSPAARSAHVVDVTAVERSTGRRVYYQMAPAGAFYSSLIIDAAAVNYWGSQFRIETTIGTTPVVGLLGGDADLAVGPSFFAEEADDLRLVELHDFLDQLHPASLEAWHEATAEAEVDAAVRAADTLFGPPLVDG